MTPPSSPPPGTSDPGTPAPSDSTPSDSTPSGPAPAGPASHDRFQLRHLFTLAPLNGDHYVGLRAGLGILVPLLMLIVLQRIDLAPYAVFGAFVGIYSRVPGHLDRLLMQVKAGALMWLVVLLAGLTGSYVVHHLAPSVGAWWLVGLTTLVAGAASVCAAYLRLRPAGSLFHIFAFAAIASIPEPVPLSEGMFTTTSAMILALVLGQVGRLAPLRRTPWQVTPVPTIPPSAKRAIWREGLAYLVAAGVAGAVAVLLSGPLGMGHTYWAMVAAVVPLAGRSTRLRVIRAVHRVLGTGAGLGLMALMVLIQPQPWLAVLIIGLMQFLAEVFVTRNYFWAMVFVTPLALVGGTLGRALTPSILYDRAVETLIGAVIGVVAVLLMDRFSRPKAHSVHVIQPG